VTALRRRSLVLSAATLGGALLVGWGLTPPRSRLGSASWWPAADGEIALNGWIKITKDGGVVLAMNRSEMGQGVHTALAMLVAEELDVPLQRVRLRQAGHEAIFGSAESFVGFLPFHADAREPGQESTAFRAARWITLKVARELGINVTGGSASVADAWLPLRLAAATARARLLGAASLRWKLPVAELGVREGIVSHSSGPRAHYGQLVEQAALSPPGDVVLKPRHALRVIGKPARRIDLVDKCDGRAVYGLDVRLPDLVYASVVHAPMIGGAPGPVDVNAALRLPGVERIVRLPPLGGADAALAVLARTTWHAREAARALQVQWQPRPGGALDSKRIEASLEAAARGAAEQRSGFGFHSRGDSGAALTGSARRVEALYRAPYLAHATMEPMNCTVRIHADRRVELWAPTQVPGLARDAAARVAGVDPAAVTVHVTYLGGGFGRRLEVDFVAQAVRVAQEAGGRPVQLSWSREEDFMHDFYRPAGAALLRAGFDAQGRLQAFEAHSAGDALEPRWIERVLPAFAGPIDVPDKTTVEGLYDLPYAIPHQRIAHVATRSGVPVGNWRSVGHSHNAFFKESFIDELAFAARQDPLRFRLELLDTKPRHAAVLQLAAQKAGWSQALPRGRARGLALHESFGTICAQVVEVSSVDKQLRVLRVVTALDCGTVVHPQGVAQQVESSVVMGLSAALYGRIDIEGGAVRQQNFPDQPMLTLAQTPAIETHTVPSMLPPTGMGEPALPPVAPALANALFALTGKRLRELPLQPLLA
jgi:isoquinoline 1-oxidoreductase beta subunit